jgi:VWFA-related protein
VSRRRVAAIVALGTAIAACLWTSLWNIPLGAQGQRFQSRVAMVPLDVRVLDRNGTPVDDLTGTDFVVAEDGVRQAIAHFERQKLVNAGARPLEVLIPGAPVPPTVRREDRRVFFVALGQFWLPNARFGLVEAVCRFLRERLLPQDYAAVSAFGRVTDLTTDHEGLARVIERLLAYQQSLANGPDRIARTRALYGAASSASTSEARHALDEIFTVASAGPHLVLRPTGPDIATLLATIEAHVVSAARAAAGGAAIGSRGEPAGSFGVEFLVRATSSHLLNMLAAVQYLRYVDGEKHLVDLPAGAVALPAVDDDRSIARIASDARVAIHVIRALGLPGFEKPGSFVALESSMESKHIASLTGGLASIDRDPGAALATIDQLTRTGYLLAYYPTRPEADGRHRKITVTVTRPRGAVVMARQSYLATDRPARYDVQQFVAQDRILAVGAFAGVVEELAVALTASAKGRAVDLEVRVDASRITTTQEAGRHNGRLEVALFCSDAREQLVGELWQTVDLKLKSETFERVLAEGFRQTASVNVSRSARWVKVVVYDYGTGRAGSAVVRLD